MGINDIKNLLETVMPTSSIYMATDCVEFYGTMRDDYGACWCIEGCFEPIGDYLYYSITFIIGNVDYDGIVGSISLNECWKQNLMDLITPNFVSLV